MNQSQSRGNIFEPQVLATDLDGTLIPNDETHHEALQALDQLFSESDKSLVFVTGRDFDLTRQAIHEHKLPVPEWIICDVGSSIFKRNAAGVFEPVEDYRQHLSSLCQDFTVAKLREQLEKWPGLRLQEESKQGEFKLSFYASADDVDQLEKELVDWLETKSAPWSIIGSIDPFTNDGLIDFLPSDVSKAFALEWWRRHEEWEQEQIVFSGDSGNDFAALTAGYLSIVVGNAAESVREKVQATHKDQNWTDLLHLADGHSTTGVLEGCRHYGMF